MILMVQLSGVLPDSFSGLPAYRVRQIRRHCYLNTAEVICLFFSAAQSPTLVADLLLVLINVINILILWTKIKSRRQDFIEFQLLYDFTEKRPILQISYKNICKLVVALFLKKFFFLLCSLFSDPYFFISIFFSFFFLFFSLV